MYINVLTRHHNIARRLSTAGAYELPKDTRRSPLYTNLSSENKDTRVSYQSMFKLRIIPCTISCIPLAINLDFSLHCTLVGAHLLKRLFEDKHCGAEGQAELKGYIGEPLITSTIERGFEQGIACYTQ